MKQVTITFPRWTIAEMTGYEPKTTLRQDFSIADAFGVDAVKDTFNRAFEEWKTDHVYLTELVLVLNHKIWQHYETNEPLARIYNDLWSQADIYAAENLKGAELEYFYRVTD